MTMTSEGTGLQETTGTGTAVCHIDDLVPGRGVAALVDGVQVAVFRLADGTIHAIGNRDPFSGANVLSRGITGTWDGVATVASPVFKQRFALATGVCIDDDAVTVPVHRIDVVDGSVLVSVVADG